MRLLHRGLAALLLLAVGCSPAASEPEPDSTPYVHIEGLGSLHFPNSGAAQAQDPFLRGVLLMHSFEFEPAAEAFRAAQEADPDFALAYWGEAMTYNHPLWQEQDRDAALDALGRLGATPEERAAKAGTERERLYLEAIETLYAPTGSKTARDQRYMEAMRRLLEAYPEDDEARAFYALSILGSRDGSRDFATYMRAAATVQPVFDANPDHPGAARRMLVFEPSPMVGRVVFVSTPHRGSRMADSALGHFAAFLAGRLEDLADTWRALVRANPDLVAPELERALRRGGFTSIGTLSPSHPLLTALAEQPISSDVPVHSILGDRGRDGAARTDGVVTWASAHLDEARSELLVPAGHDAYEHPYTTAEIKRILRQHLERAPGSLPARPTTARAESSRASLD